MTIQAVRNDDSPATAHDWVGVARELGFTFAQRAEGYDETGVFAAENYQDLRDARLVLISATRVVIANGLAILGVSAPETM